MEDAKKMKEVEEVCNEAASFILSLEKEFFLEEIEMIYLLLEEMQKSLQTLDPEPVKIAMRNIRIIGENRDWALIEAYEC